MLKIKFYLKKPKGEQNNLEYITISNLGKEVLEDKLTVQYFCELYQSYYKSKMLVPSRISPIDAILFALENAKVYLQFLLDKGYTVSDIENKQEWKLEKKSPREVMQKKIEEIKNDKNIPTEVKQKILEHFKKSFSNPMFKGQLENLI